MLARSREIARMFGCESAATAFASRSKRAERLGIAGEVRRQHLDRDVAIEPVSRAR